jgi:hypothetical protein
MEVVGIAEIALQALREACPDRTLTHAGYANDYDDHDLSECRSLLVIEKNIVLDRFGEAIVLIGIRNVHRMFLYLGCGVAHGDA